METHFNETNPEKVKRLIIINKKHHNKIVKPIDKQNHKTETLEDLNEMEVLKTIQTDLQTETHVNDDTITKDYMSVK